jgi:HD-like signal output (HDOD) protein
METQCSGALLAELWSHSMTVGILANKIALMENRDAANDAFTAGLLHDLGRVVLAVNLPRQYKTVDEIIERDCVSRPEAEKQVFDATHSEVGAFLLGLWGLPTNVVEAVAFHNNPGTARNNTFSALTAVHAANAIQRQIKADGPGKSEAGLDMDYLASIGLTHRIPAWQEKCAAFTENIA